MTNESPAGPGRGQERTPFASWLDSIIPAIFSNDAAFAQALGVNQSQVHRWRRGVVPQAPALMKMSKLTGTAIETLVQIAGYRPDTEDGRS
jgi:hypothetical protein